MSLLLFGNNDLTANVQASLVSQLFLNEVISLDEWNARLAGNPEYPLIIQQNNIHLLVLGSYYNITNRSIFDFCLFFKAGQCAIESCQGSGPPGISFPIAYLTENQLRHHFPNCGCWDGYSCCNNPNIQNNILFPLDCKVCEPNAFPFGESCSKPIEPIPNPYNLPVFCVCGDRFPWVGG
jgi:hypothetical protein